MNESRETSSFYELCHVIDCVKGFLELCSSVEDHSFLADNFNLLANDLKERLNKSCLEYENKMLGK